MGTIDIDTDIDIDIDIDIVTDTDIDIVIDTAPVDNVTEVTLHENNKIKNINIKTSDEVTLLQENKNI